MKRLIQIVSLLIVFIFWTGEACACGKAYGGKSDLSELPSAKSTLSAESYEEYRKAGMRLHDDGNIDLTLPYFRPLTEKGIKDRPILNLESVEKDPAWLEKCCAYYAFIIDFFENYTMKTGNMTQKQKEAYTAGFSADLGRAMTGVREVTDPEENQFIWEFFKLPRCYLWLEGSYCIDECVFRMKYYDCFTFYNYDDIALVVLKKAKKAFETESAKKAMNVLRKYEKFRIPETLNTEYLIHVFELTSETR